MNHDRLAYIIFMNVHKNETKILSLDKITEDFIAPNERKSFVVGVKKYNEKTERGFSYNADFWNF